eukprot:1319422-Amorphochlora_amoeboformis.AAC.1
MESRKLMEMFPTLDVETIRRVRKEHTPNNEKTIAGLLELTSKDLEVIQNLKRKLRQFRQEMRWKVRVFFLKITPALEGSH